MAVLIPRAGSSRRILLAVVITILLILVFRRPTANSPVSDWTASDTLSHLRDASSGRPGDTQQATLDTPHHRAGNKKIDDNTNPRGRLTKQFQEWLQWDPPVGKDHYPPYDEYEGRDYDPNRWETFPQYNFPDALELYTSDRHDRENGLFLNGTTRYLRGRQSPAQRPYLPYPNYNSEEWLEENVGRYVYCEGPRGKPLNQSYEDLMTAYMSRPVGLPYPDIGSWEAVGLHEDLCFDRYGRLGPYGLDVDTNEAGVTRPSHVDWERVEWGRLQDECTNRNRDRFSNAAVARTRTGKMTDHFGLNSPLQKRQSYQITSSTDDSYKQHQKRTAILIRTWDDYKYRENDKQMIRSLITELSLLSGGEYHVFLFVNVKDKTIPIFTDDAAYQRALEEYVPEEFRDIAILWTEEVCEDWYPKVQKWEVYWSQFMPLQWFSRTHPEFDYVWNWEMDARLIGHHYHFLEQMASFAKYQPRKYLWERNSRYYIPRVHGTWDQYFRATNDVVTKAKKTHLKTVWGPQNWTDDQQVLGPVPPHDEDQDDFEWGVGEDADFITLLPLWDPRDTFWSYRDKLFNYPWGEGSYEERPFPHIPRRVFINTVVRMSKKLLEAMHRENEAGYHMASEIWPGSIALQHGLKAVYAPHPIWISHKWPADYMEYVYNADGWGAGAMPGHDSDDGRGRGYIRELELAGKLQNGTGPNREGLAGRWGQERDSPYSPDREHNFAGWSWYFWSDFSRIIYWRWLGWKAGFSIVTIKGTEVTDELGIVGGGQVCIVYTATSSMANKPAVRARARSQLLTTHASSSDQRRPTHGREGSRGGRRAVTTRAGGASSGASDLSLGPCLYEKALVGAWPSCLHPVADGVTGSQMRVLW